jgi:hypothetical protein
MLHFVLPLINLIVPVIHYSFLNFVNPLSGIVSRGHKILPLPTYYVGRETFCGNQHRSMSAMTLSYFTINPVINTGFNFIIFFNFNSNLVYVFKRADERKCVCLSVCIPVSDFEPLGRFL